MVKMFDQHNDVGLTGKNLDSCPLMGIHFEHARWHSVKRLAHDLLTSHEVPALIGVSLFGVFKGVLGRLRKWGERGRWKLRDKNRCERMRSLVVALVLVI